MHWPDNLFPVQITSQREREKSVRFVCVSKYMRKICLAFFCFEVQKGFLNDKCQKGRIERFNAMLPRKREREGMHVCVCASVCVQACVCGHGFASACVCERVCANMGLRACVCASVCVHACVLNVRARVWVHAYSFCNSIICFQWFLKDPI